MTKGKTKPREMSAAGKKILAGLKQLQTALETGDFSKVTVRTMEITEPGKYGAREVRALRDRLGVSQGIFAALVGVSPVLVAHWEHGIRKPAPLACRLFDKIKENPPGYLASLMHRRTA